MTRSCNTLVLYPSKESKLFDEALIYSLYLGAFVSIAGSYAAVMKTANSLATDQVSARRARHTILLHLFQLSMMLLSTLHDVLQGALYQLLPPLVFLRMQTLVYMLLILMPKSLSALVYALRDPTIRAALLLRFSFCHKGQDLGRR
ncbi:unnamed protein product [Knipowitschia caucasica]